MILLFAGLGLVFAQMVKSLVFRISDRLTGGNGILKAVLVSDLKKARLWKRTNSLASFGLSIRI